MSIASKRKNLVTKHADYDQRNLRTAHYLLANQSRFGGPEYQFLFDWARL